MRMAGKIGIVTAAASGMGRAGALRFAREGAQVAVVDVDADGVKRVVGEITAAGGIARTQRWNRTKPWRASWSAQPTGPGPGAGSQRRPPF